ncbi:hypothetical protein HNR09_001736 [Nesterenkonia xinjiangensis]|uniref:Uncharacterized protein n=1 Tax=Nesterenkonia xinjiangensis TaxID=225327 RepID=A0A7Z0GLW2_9MICC|nr:hypothetical protein [Nesterenkonia xinjiangensis]
MITMPAVASMTGMGIVPTVPVMIVMPGRVLVVSAVLAAWPVAGVVRVSGEFSRAVA